MTAASGAFGGRLGDGLDVLVVLSPWVAEEDVPALADVAAKKVIGLTEVAPTVDEVDAVVFVARDFIDLRRCVGATQSLPSSRRVGCLFLASPAPSSISMDAIWPAVVSWTVQTEPTSCAVVEFARPVRTGAVLAAMAREATRGGLAFTSWPRIGVRRDQPHRWPPGDNAAVVATAESLVDLSRFFAPDIVVVDERTDLPESFTGLGAAATHDVLGRLPVLAGLGPELTWEDCDRLSPAAVADQLARAGPLCLGGLDQLLLNPKGYRREQRRPVARLVAHPDPDRLVAETSGRKVVLDAHHGIAEADVAALRPYQGVHLTWTGGRGPQAYCRVVAALALAGVPLSCDPTPQWARALVHPDLVEAIEAPAEPQDLGAREVRSIRQRRAAHTHHSALGWRRSLAARYGVQSPSVPAVSVLLPTRRPDQLAFALRQVARQRRDGIDLELVLIAHGFEPERAVLDRFADCAVPLTVVRASADRPFGAVLNDGAARAAGDVLLKMDDDDWYGRDLVSDLLLARDYSGAEVVGCSPEFTFVEPLWQTVRHKEATEKFAQRVAGGTLLVDRGMFAAAGGFRETRRSVDGAVLAAIRAAGGSVYRTHGHGYVLRRLASGHTWDPGMDFFTDPERSWLRWDGFVPSPLLDPDPEDLPIRSAVRD